MSHLRRSTGRIAVVLVVGLATAYSARAAQSTPASAEPTATGTYLTLLFSRTEVGAADNCVPDDADIEPLYTSNGSSSVAAYLQSLGFTATGSLVTGKPNMLTKPSTEGCVHQGDSLSADWQDASTLAATYGWSFISHTATYPGAQRLAELTPAQQYRQTCGSAAAITAHGIPGATGMIAYPGAQPPPAALQAVASACIDWGRTYGGTPPGITTSAAGSTAPYWQHTEAVLGGPCDDTTQTQPGGCYEIAAVGSTRYTPPSTIISQIEALQPGQWFTLQAYLLVNGTNPPYTTNRTRWDCSSPNPADHWTTDSERYCYNDYQTIVDAIAAYNQQAQDQGSSPIIVTDPRTVGIAFGRPY